MELHEKQTQLGRLLLDAMVMIDTDRLFAKIEDVGWIGESGVLSYRVIVLDSSCAELVTQHVLSALRGLCRDAGVEFRQVDGEDRAP